MDFVISELVEVKAPGIRLGHRGRVVNRFARNQLLYAVQFPDNCVGYFESWELEKVRQRRLPPIGKGGEVFKI